MRLASMLIILFLIQIGVSIMGATLDTNSPDLNPYSSTNSSLTGTNANYQVWSFFFQPYKWSTADYLIFFMTIMVVGGGIALGLTYVFKLELTLLFPVFLVLLALGSLPIGSLYNFILGAVFEIMCTTMPCFPATLVAGLICGPLALLWLFSCVEWWTGRMMT